MACTYMQHAWYGATCTCSMHGMGLHVHAACMVWGYMYMQHAWYGATCTCSMHGMGLHVHAACMVWGYMCIQHAYMAHTHSRENACYWHWALWRYSISWLYWLLCPERTCVMQHRAMYWSYTPHTVTWLFPKASKGVIQQCVCQTLVWGYLPTKTMTRAQCTCS